MKMPEDFHVQWHITDKCNLKCKHCYGVSFSGGNDLTWPELKKVCDNLINTMKRQNKVLTLSLTGGEPFLKEELPDLVSYLSYSEYIKEISLITNAVLIDRFKDTMGKFSRLKNIYVSLDGFRSEVNDYIRGKGVFKKVIDNIGILKEKGFKVVVMFTILRHNLKDIGKLEAFLNNSQADGIIFERFIPSGRGKSIESEQLVTKKELEQVYRQVFACCGVNFFPESVRYQALKVELEAKNLELSGSDCVVANSGCAVLPQGDVYPCRRFPLVLGNLVRESLADIWLNSEVLNKLRVRNNLKGKCRSCIIEECRGCRATAYALKKDYLEQDPLCWLES
jgi:radical SAM protein with 4Fe4S-binding SPASM domain